MSQDRIKAHLALLGANVFYGAGFTIAKMVMPAFIKPMGFILIRVAIVTVLFWLSYMGGKAFKTKIDRSDWPRLIGCGLFGVATNQLLFFLGLNLTSPIHASLMMLCTPILVSMFAMYILREKINLKILSGLSLGVIGATMLVTLGKQDKVATNPILGDMLVFLNATSYAIYLVMVKPLMQKYRPIIVIRWVFLIGLFFVFPFGITEFRAINWSVFTLHEYAAVAFIVIGCTFFTYLWNIYALRILSPSTAGAYIYLQPAFAAFIAILFFNEELGWIKIISSVLIFSGVYLVSSSRSKIHITKPVSMQE
jgi:drug/metabolite transporter (DMT)-like permease